MVWRTKRATAEQVFAGGCAVHEVRGRSRVLHRSRELAFRVCDSGTRMAWPNRTQELQCVDDGDTRGSGYGRRRRPPPGAPVRRRGCLAAEEDLHQGPGCALPRRRKGRILDATRVRSAGSALPGEENPSLLLGSRAALLVGLQNGVGDASAVGDLVPVLASPLPHRRGVLTVARGRTCGSGGSRGLAATTAPSGCGDERSQGVPKSCRVLARQVDLVLPSGERKRHRLIGFRTVQVVDEPGLNLLGHRSLPFD